jgi:polyferredoxin/Pyruvate/2-oxoacid:ferredoxin oxidoreductase delta subunit
VVLGFVGQAFQPAFVGGMGRIESLPHMPQVNSTGINGTELICSLVAMKITTVRRVSQIFFFLLFLWFCVAGSPGQEWWKMRGWPVDWLLQLDPLAALATVLTTHALYAGFAWAVVSIVLTILLGRFFCGWVCPFGSLHQFVGFLGKKGKTLSDRMEVNRYHGGQIIKYYVLVFLLAASAGSLPGLVPSLGRIVASSLQTGLLDPIPLVYRSVNLVLAPLLDAGTHKLFIGQRFYEGAWLISLIFFSALLLNLWRPRFYCRFVCPLGALFGLVGRYALWRVGRAETACKNCRLCTTNCEGACEPASVIRVHECVLCMNCLHDCKQSSIVYATEPSAAGEISAPDLSRRGALITLFSGVLALPILRLSGNMGPNWNPDLIRPPGALAEEDFLARCTKCGQCMRVCPTNIIQPAGSDYGMEALWTPILNFRIGSSGCQRNCVACGHICPTAAIRPLSLDEKLGRNAYAGSGPVKIGTAFVDRGRCLPWAMDKPCIVCQENCPVSPKAIWVSEIFKTVRDGIFTVKACEGTTIDVAGGAMRPGEIATGDYYVRMPVEGDSVPRRITGNSEHSITFEPSKSANISLTDGAKIEVQVRLLRPRVDPSFCTGCGVCEHECPVSGRRAIRVSAENESRITKHSFLLETAKRR